MKKISAFLFLIYFMFISVELAQACEPYPEYWYLETITLAETTLPENISIQITDPNTSPQASIWIKNENEEPIFILPVDVFEQMTSVHSQEQIKNAQNRAFKSLAAHNNLLQLVMSDLQSLDATLVDVNPLDMNRPEESKLQVPAPARSKLVLLYRDQIVTVPFKITYTINPHNSAADCVEWYDHIALTESKINTENKAVAAARSQELIQQSFAGLLIVGFVITGVVAVVFFVRNKRIRN